MSIRKGSELCLACGLCCNGVLHAYVPLHKTEIPLAKALALPVITQNGKQTFALPCPCFQNNNCTIYRQRPRTCQQYRCQLLTRYLNGEIAMAEGMALISQTRQLVDKIQKNLPPGASQRMFDHLDGLLDNTGGALPPETADLLMDFVALHVLCRKHFHKPHPSTDGK